MKTLLLFLAALLCLSSAAPASTIPIISIAERNPVAGVSTVIGKVDKHPSNPLFVQDKPWEPRLVSELAIIYTYYDIDSKCCDRIMDIRMSSTSPRRGCGAAGTAIA